MNPAMHTEGGNLFLLTVSRVDGIVGLDGMARKASGLGALDGGGRGGHGPFHTHRVESDDSPAGG